MTKFRKLLPAALAAVGELVDWALSIRDRHRKEVRDGSLEPAAAEDPESD